MGKMEQTQADKKEVQKGKEQTGQKGQGVACVRQNGGVGVKYGRYWVTSTFAGTESLTDLLECYIDRVGSLRYGA